MIGNLINKVLKKYADNNDPSVHNQLGSQDPYHDPSKIRGGQPSIPQSGPTSSAIGVQTCTTPIMNSPVPAIPEMVSTVTMMGQTGTRVTIPMMATHPEGGIILRPVEPVCPVNIPSVVGSDDRMSDTRMEPQISACGTPSAVSSISNTSSSEVSEPVPKTLTAYQAFFRQTFDELKVKAMADSPDGKCPTNAIVASIGERWRALSVDGRAAYAGSSEEINRKKKKARTNKRGRAENSVRPKRSLTAYQLFFRETYAELSGKAAGSVGREGITQNEIVRTIGERWRAIDADNLARYKARAAEDAAKFEAEQPAVPENAGEDMKSSKKAKKFKGSAPMYKPQGGESWHPGQGERVISSLADYKARAAEEAAKFEAQQPAGMAGTMSLINGPRALVKQSESIVTHGEIIKALDPASLAAFKARAAEAAKFGGGGQMAQSSQGTAGSSTKTTTSGTATSSGWKGNAVIAI